MAVPAERFISDLEAALRRAMLADDVDARDGMAIVTVRARVAGRFAGATFDGAYRYLRVWAPVRDRWQIVAGCVTEVVA